MALTRCSSVGLLCLNTSPLFAEERMKWSAVCAGSYPLFIHIVGQSDHRWAPPFLSVFNAHEVGGGGDA
jgi:hypothetical protein